MTNPANNTWGNPTENKWQQPSSTQKKDEQALAPKNNQWGNNSQNLTKNENSSWAELLKPTFQGTVEMRKVDDISQKYVKKGAEGEGELSIETHKKQMAIVEKTLDNMITNMNFTINDIVKTVASFRIHVEESNKKISAFCNAILDRGLKIDDTLQPDDVQKATALVNFAAAGVLVMKQSSEAALDLADKGASIISKHTLAAINVIFEARSKQVALFAQKVEIFHKQEQHDLDIMLKLQDTKLKEQAQLFEQMKQVVQLESELDKVKFTQEMEVRKVDLENTLKIRSLDIQEEEVNNAKEIKLAEQSMQERIKTKEIKVNQKLENKKIDTDAKIKEKAIWHDYNARVIESNNNANVAITQSHDKKDADMFKAATDAAKPSCTVM
jgi:hypothetical protein